ncbi:MAG: hypothetical protein AB1813_07610 [Verrucomicrobiota bacterium]|jgi:hypothetical protein
MRQQSFWASALALAMTTASCMQMQAGIIMISSRKNLDSSLGNDHLEERGPGQTTPGDVAMGLLLGDHGYSFRLAADVLLSDPNFLIPANADFKIDLIIFSGSSSSADVQAAPADVPVMMGEHVTLGNNAGRVGSIFMYNGTQSTDPNEGNNATKFMKVVDPNHPIMAGIPLDSEGRVRIFREKYPEEESHVPTGGKKNYEYRWCTQLVADKAPGTTILGVLDGTPERSCLAVVDKGGMLANEQAAGARLVHMFTNENGSGGSRRVFNAVTELGRVIFVRAAKWALGEELQPFKASFRIVEAKQSGPQGVMLTWESSTAYNYSIEASSGDGNWQPVVTDISGAEGTLSHTLQVAAAEKTLFLRVGRVP